jgi:DNA-binding response OmpR family regulator
MKVLVIEDDPTVGNFVRRGLEEQRWGVQLVADGEEGERLATSDAYDVVILDMRLPGKSGMDVLNSLRARGFERPVLVLTAQDAVDAKVNALRAGADDYVTKPFALEELVARMRALLRRTSVGEDELLRFADLELDPGTREVRRGGDLIELTRTEFALLELFLTNPRQVLTRSIIFERVWGYDFGFASNSLDVYIGYLRRKTEAGDKPRLIQTVRGVGYALREP